MKWPGRYRKDRMHDTGNGLSMYIHERLFPKKESKKGRRTLVRGPVFVLSDHGGHTLVRNSKVIQICFISILCCFVFLTLSKESSLIFLQRVNVKVKRNVEIKWKCLTISSVDIILKLQRNIETRYFVSGT